MPGSLCRFVSNASRKVVSLGGRLSESRAAGCVHGAVRFPPGEGGGGGPEGRSGVSLRGWRSKGGASVVWDNTQ